jgi:hypothetical protein
MAKLTASLSLDLDNKWSYLKTHGNDAWQDLPSYLEQVTPRILELLRNLDVRITVFVVGQDAVQPENHDSLAAFAADGHELGNHSFHHEPWLHEYSREALVRELADTEAALESATGQTPIGFRGPGYSCPPLLLELLNQRGYQYDASSLPTFLGPLARAYYLATAKLDRKQAVKRKMLFGTFSDGWKPLRPHWHEAGEARILRIPVTTMPVFRTPIHFSYLLYLQQYSSWIALVYFRIALTLCRVRGIEPSFLLHPLDFLGREDDEDLAFFPAMKSPRSRKLHLLNTLLRNLCRRYDVISLREHAQRIVTKSTHDVKPGP